MRFTLTRDERNTDTRWSGIKPIRTPTEVAAILNMTVQEVERIEHQAFHKLRQLLPPANNRLEAARAIEISHLFTK